jgi:hypothetical protein
MVPCLKGELRSARTDETSATGNEEMHGRRKR